MAGKECNIIQWNCRGIRANRADLFTMTSELDPVALCLQELKVRKNKDIPRFKKYKSYSKIPDPDHASGGVALVIKKSYPQRWIDLNTNLQAVAVRVTINKPVTLCSLYLPPDERPTYQELTSLVEQLPAPYILLGDFNAHSTVWGSHHTSGKGRMIERLLDKKSLCLFNNGTPTFLCRSGRRSALDLTICHPAVFAEYDWRVHNDPLGSDHFPIILKTIKANSNEDQPGRWKTYKADWNEFQNTCGRSFLPWELVKDKENPTKYFTETLREVSTMCIPKTSKHPLTRPCHWFNDECRESRKARRKALRKMEGNMNLENMLAYYQEKAKTKLLYNETKRESFREYVSTIDTSTPLKKVYEKVKKLNGKPTPLVNHIKVGNENMETAERDCRLTC